MSRWEPPRFVTPDSEVTPAAPPPVTPRVAGRFEALITPQELAEYLRVDLRWVYRHASGWPFTRKLGRKCLRFDPVGLRRWIEGHGPPGPPGSPRRGR